MFNTLSLYTLAFLIYNGQIYRNVLEYMNNIGMYWNVKKIENADVLSYPLNLNYVNRPHSNNQPISLNRLH